MRFQLFALLFAAAIVSSCAKKEPFQPGVHLALVDAAALPPPTGIFGPGGVPAYRIGAFDKLAINVFSVPELSGSVHVDSAGRISIPLVGVIDALGMTPEELERIIEEGLRGRYVRNPQVSVNPEEIVSQMVTVDGQVQLPGQYPVPGRTTLMRSIALARGTTEFADVDDVVVFRTVGDQEMAALYNLGAIRRGSYVDPDIYANDLIVVGDSPARRLFRDYLQAGGLLATPIITVLQRL